MRATEGDLELLLALATETSSARDDAMLATAPRACLPMGALAAVSDGARQLLPDEAEHVEGCVRCSARLRALGTAPAPRVPRAARRTTPVARRRLLPYLGLAACAALAIVCIPPWSDQGPPATPETPAPAPVAVPEPARSCELDVCVDDLSTPASDAGARNLQLQITSAEDVVAVAILHGWDDDCQCVRSRIHHMEAEDGTRAMRSSLPNGVAVSLGVQVAAAATGEQRLLLFAARDPSVLPHTDTAADRLLECLGDADGSDSESELTSAASSCLDEPICVRSVLID